MSNDLPVMHVGLCDDCLTIQAAWPHPERSDPVPNPSQWEDFASDCKVCGDGRVEWLETVPVTDYLKRGF